jgi:hypothetical protein
MARYEQVTLILFSSQQAAVLATWRPQLCRVKGDIFSVLASRIREIQESVLNGAKT